MWVSNHFNIHVAMALRFWCSKYQSLTSIVKKNLIYKYIRHSKPISRTLSIEKFTIIIYYSRTCTESQHPQITGVPHNRGILVHNHSWGIWPSDSKSDLTVSWNRHWPWRDNINHRLWLNRALHVWDNLWEVIRWWNVSI